MRNARILVGAALFMAVMAGAMVAVSGPTTEAGDQKTAITSHWRHHDGHWNYWHVGDQRWYYTDGSNWFYNNANANNGNAWNVYNFDKGFGREGFQRGEYKVPGDGTKIIAPNHGFYRVPNK